MYLACTTNVSRQIIEWFRFTKGYCTLFACNHQRLKFVQVENAEIDVLGEDGVIGAGWQNCALHHDVMDACANAKDV